MRRASVFAAISGARAITTIHKSKHPSIQNQLDGASSLTKFFRERSEALADRTCFVDGNTGKEVTFQQAFERAELIAAALYRKYNIRHGDIVTFVSPNTVDYASVFQAVIMLGAVVSPLSPAYSAEEIEKHIKLADSKLLVSYTPFKASTEKAAVAASVPLFLADEPLGIDTPARTSEIVETSKDDIVVLPFSSGTTGLPKGVQLSNQNMLANLFQFNTVVELFENDVIMAVLPYFHIFGMLVVMMGPLSVGAKQVVMPRFNLPQYVSLMEQYKATNLFVAPPMLLDLKNKADQFPALKSMSHVRQILSGAAPLTPTLHQSIESIFPNAQVRQGYGLTETSPILTLSVPGSKIYASAGSLLPDTELRIVDLSHELNVAEDPPQGESGEIWVRGPQVMQGYAKIDNTNVFQDGWFRTGDIGYVDPKTETLHITDRLKELIKCRGFQVAPAELEALIISIPKVEDVVVYSVPAPCGHDEMPIADVVLKGTTSETMEADKLSILEFVASKVPTYKQLQGIRIVDEIPKSLSGKVLRRVAKQSYIDSTKNQ